MKLSLPLRSMVLACFALVSSSQPALLHAADGTWIQSTAGPFDWNAPGNWASSIVADGVDSTAFFTPNITANQTVNLSAAQTIGNITFTDSTTSSHNLTISGNNSLTLDVTTGTPVIDVTQLGRTLFISSVIAGNDGFQKNGPGTLNVTGANTYTGGTTVTGGTLTLGSSARTAVNSGPIFLSGGGELNPGLTSTHPVTIGTGGGTFRLNGNGAWTTTGNLTGSDTLSLTTGTGTGFRILSFNSTANDFTGGIIINGMREQTIQFNSLLDSANNIAFTYNPVVGTSNGTGTFRYSSNATAATAPLTLANRAFELNGGNSTTTLTGTIENLNTTHAITINTDLVVTGAGAKTLGLAAAAGPTNVFAGDIANETDGGDGILSVLKSGAGVWELHGINTYTGNTTVSAGTLTLADTSSTLFEIAASEINNSILGTGTVNLNGAFFFDLTNASTDDGDFWNIVNVGTLSETYGGTFSVGSSLGSFTDNAGEWSLVDGANTWTFSQSSGVLSIAVVPEPGTLALLAGGALASVALLRRRRNNSV